MVFHAVGTTPWKQCERDYVIPGNASFIELDFGNSGKKGSIDFSCISLSVAELN